jgi:hypothetical protein
MRLPAQPPDRRPLLSEDAGKTAGAAGRAAGRGMEQHKRSKGERKPSCDHCDAEKDDGRNDGPQTYAAVIAPATALRSPGYCASSFAIPRIGMPTHSGR